MKNGVFIIGVTGRSGSGKGYVCASLACFGIPTIDTDRVYHSLVSMKDGTPGECLSELVREFGSGIIDESGSFDRKALSAIVFAPGAAERLKTLNKITHKYILCETLRLIGEYANHGVKALTVDAPLLFESGFDSICDITLCVSAPEAKSIKRICERDGIGESAAEARLSTQKSAAELEALCDEVIINDGERDIEAQIEALISKHSLERT